MQIEPLWDLGVPGEMRSWLNRQLFILKIMHKCHVVSVLVSLSCSQEVVVKFCEVGWLWKLLEIGRENNTCFKKCLEGVHEFWTREVFLGESPFDLQRQPLQKGPMRLADGFGKWRSWKRSSSDGNSWTDSSEGTRSARRPKSHRSESVSFPGQQFQSLQNSVQRATSLKTKRQVPEREEIHHWQETSWLNLQSNQLINAKKI